MSFNWSNNSARYSRNHQSLGNRLDFGAERSAQVHCTHRPVIAQLIAITTIMRKLIIRSVISLKTCTTVTKTGNRFPDVRHVSIALLIVFVVQVRAQETKQPTPRHTDTSTTVTKILPVNNPESAIAKNNLSNVESGLINTEYQPALVYSSEQYSAQPKLAIKAPTTLYLREGVLDTAYFYVISNYATFIRDWELNVYRAEDTAKREPVFQHRSDENIMESNPIAWKSAVNATPIKGGDQLIYQLTVKGYHGGVDKTHEGHISVDSHYKSATNHAPPAQPAVNWYSSLAQRNDLRTRGIPINGSLITVHGQGFPAQSVVLVNGIAVSADDNGNFTFETHRKAGDFKIPVSVGNANRSLTGSVAQQYFFLAALADITAGEGRVRGSDAWVETLTQDDHFNQDIYVDGRLAFYLKGKIKGKYIVTAQLDTQEGDIADILKNLDKRDDRDSLLERIDPDRYYPVYGDTSTIVDDVDTQGKFYVRVDWDHSKLLWGNYHTNLSGTELGDYNRTLYGAQLDYRSVGKTAHGDHRVQINAFVAQPTSMAARDELRGTGGSLYYLRHQDIVLGSDKLWVEQRDPITERVLERITLRRDVDYQFNAAQGRVILNEPLSSIATRFGPSVVQQSALDGDELYLIASYEYEVVDTFDDNNLNSGGRAKAWLSDYLGVGATRVEEENGNQSYEKSAADITLKATNNSYITFEYAKSENGQLLDFNQSSNGGISNTQPTSSTNQGRAYRVDARLDLQDISDLKGQINLWTLDQEAGFERYTRLNESYKQHGLEANLAFSDLLGTHLRHVQDTNTGNGNGTDSTTTQSQIQLDFRLNDSLTLSGEYRQDETEQSGTVTDSKDTVGLLASVHLSDTTRVYAKGQHQIDEAGLSAQNISANQYTLGLENRVSDRFRYHFEGSDGDLGQGASVGASFTPWPGHDFYASLDSLQDKDKDTQSFTIGQRSQLSNKLSVYQEFQFDDRHQTHGNDEDSLDRVWGFRYQLNKGWSVGASYDYGSVEQSNEPTISKIDRQTGSARIDYKDTDTHFSTRIELREEDTADASTDESTSTDQYLLAGKLRQLVNEEWTLLSRLDLSETETDENREAFFADGQLGFAYRPRDNDRWNLLGMYRYFYELNPLSQAESETDQRAHIFSLNGVYELSRRWELGWKLAYKKSDLRLDRDAGNWVSATQNLEAIRLRYHLIKEWDVMGELRRREVEDNGAASGALVEAGYHIGDHMRFSVGYNFTDFSSDLADNDYSRGGWFINLIGKY